MTTARLAIFRAPRAPFEFDERPLPPCGEGEALVAISLATICGSDLHTADGRRTEPAPCVLGHEAVGRVIAVGAGRDSALVGRRVTWTLADSCGTCVPCREWHLPQKCEHLFKYGHAALDNGTGLNGCYASHILLRRGTTIIPIPDALPDEFVAPANCALATMVSATEQLPNPCRVAVIQGAGMLGLYACALLHARGVGRVIVVDTNPERLALVESFGGEPALRTAGSLVQTGRVDAVFEVAGTSAVVPEGLRLLRPGGFYAFVGMVHPATALDLTGETVVRRCLTIRGFHNYAPRHLERSIAFLDECRAAHPWHALVSDAFPLAELDAAFALARTQRWPRVAVRSGSSAKCSVFRGNLASHR
jgi:putative phosphonate catabolism associated alcohol dehydrogenase